MITRRKLLIAIGLTAVASPLGSLAQRQNRVWRIGMLETTSMALNAANLDAFRKGLQELGYVEGRNYIIEYRSADGHIERFPDLAAELVRRKVDLIVLRGTPAAQAAKKATETIPVVATAIGDPLLLVASIGRPGGNITGLSSFTTELQAKRVDLLKELVPGARRIGVLANMANASLPSLWKEAERASRSLGVQPQLLDVRKREDFEPAFDAAVRLGVDACMVTLDSLLQANRKLIIELMAKHRLPAIYQAREFIDAGGLMVYGPSYPDLYRRAASYADKILKGANPGDLPIEQPTKFELVINLKTAKALGLKIPQSMLLRADELIQ